MGAAFALGLTPQFSWGVPTEPCGSAGPDIFLGTATSGCRLQASSQQADLGSQRELGKLEGSGRRKGGLLGRTAPQSLQCWLHHDRGGSQRVVIALFSGIPVQTLLVPQS